jgi:pilus assembly protein FimV
MDVVMENWPVAAAGGGAIVLIGLWMMRRRRTSGETVDEVKTAPTLMAAAPVEPASEGLAATAAPASAAAPAVVAAVTAQAAAPAQAEEIDPLEEASVYLAHGRDAQAEATLKEALAKDPAREDIQAKLLTIYAARNDRAAFTRQAGEFNKLTGGKGDNWLKAAAMGLALDPQNPLYSAAKEAAVAEEPRAAQPAPVDLDFNLDLAAPATGGTDMAAGVQKQPSGQEPKPAADQPVEALMPDFRLEVPSAGEAQAAQGSGGGETAPAAETGALDFNIELPKIAVPESKEKGPPAEAERKDDAGLDFKVDLGDINLNLDERAKEEGAGAERDAHWYDVQAKFDLAKAYQEMGHKADARNILDEVIREGDAEQQTQAKALLRDLN